MHTRFIAPLQPMFIGFRGGYETTVPLHGPSACRSIRVSTTEHVVVVSLLEWTDQMASHGQFSGPKGQQHISPGQRRCAALEASPPPRVQEPHWSQALKERHKNPHAEVVSLLQSSGIYYLVYPGRRFVRLAPDSALPRAGLFLARWAAPHAPVAARQYATARRPCQEGVISRNGST